MDYSFWRKTYIMQQKLLLESMGVRANLKTVSEQSEYKSWFYLLLVRSSKRKFICLNFIFFLRQIGLITPLESLLLDLPTFVKYLPYCRFPMILFSLFYFVLIKKTKVTPNNEVALLPMGYYVFLTQFQGKSSV